MLFGLGLGPHSQGPEPQQVSCRHPHLQQRLMVCFQLLSHYLDELEKDVTFTLAFSCFLKPLACAIRHHRAIYRVVCNSVEYKLTLFAHDIFLFISKPPTIIPVLR